MPTSAFSTRSAWPLPILLFLLTACDGAGTCDSIPLQAYTAEFTQQVGIDMASASKPLQIVILDYHNLREEVKACKGEK